MKTPAKAWSLPNLIGQFVSAKAQQNVSWEFTPLAGHYLSLGKVSYKIMAKNLTQWPMCQFCVVIALAW